MTRLLGREGAKHFQRYTYSVRVNLKGRDRREYAVCVCGSAIEKGTLGQSIRRMSSKQMTPRTIAVWSENSSAENTGPHQTNLTSGEKSGCCYIKCHNGLLGPN